MEPLELIRLRIEIGGLDHKTITVILIKQDSRDIISRVPAAHTILITKISLPNRCRTKKIAFYKKLLGGVNSSEA